MGSPIDAVSKAVSSVFTPITTALSRAFTMPGRGDKGPTNISLPDPSTTTPAKIAGTKPGGRRGFQDSFLSGVAGGAAGGGLQGGGWWGGGGGGAGKSLIGQ